MLWHEPISEALDVIIDDGGSLAILMACIGINGHLMSCGTIRELPKFWRHTQRMRRSRRRSARCSLTPEATSIRYVSRRKDCASPHSGAGSRRCYAPGLRVSATPASAGFRFREHRLSKPNRLFRKLDSPT